MKLAVNNSLGLIAFNEEMKSKITQHMQCPHIEMIPQSVIAANNIAEEGCKISEISTSSFSLRKSLVIILNS